MYVPDPVPAPQGSRATTPGTPRPPSGIIAFFQAIWFTINTFLHSGWGFIPWVRPHWSIDEMRDQRGRVSPPPVPSPHLSNATQVIVITGANSGTGYATAKAYYDRGATVYLLCRSEKRALAAIEDIKRGGDADILTVMSYTAPDPAKVGTLKYVPCELSDLESVEAAAAEVMRGTDRIDVLFANAGIMAVPEGLVTKQGYPLQFGTNVSCVGGHRTGLAPRLSAAGLAKPNTQH